MAMSDIVVTFDVGEHPTICDHCGSTNMQEIGLVAPKCGDCGQFSISHVTVHEEE